MTIELKVPSMACSACATTIINAVKGIDSTAEVAADPQTKLVVIQSQQPEDAIKQAIADAGYPVEN